MRERVHSPHELRKQVLDPGAHEGTPAEMLGAQLPHPEDLRARRIARGAGGGMGGDQAHPWAPRWAQSKGKRLARRELLGGTCGTWWLERTCRGSTFAQDPCPSTPEWAPGTGPPPCPTACRPGPLHRNQETKGHWPACPRGQMAVVSHPQRKERLGGAEKPVEMVDGDRLGDSLGSLMYPQGWGRK